jgi:hypothetical protein
MSTEFCPEPSPALPAFALKVERHAPGTARVRLGAGLSDALPTLLSLEFFMNRLLRGRVWFEAEHALRPLDSMIVVTASDRCRRCAAAFDRGSRRPSR